MLYLVHRSCCVKRCLGTTSMVHLKICLLRIPLNKLCPNFPFLKLKVLHFDRSPRYCFSYVNAIFLLAAGRSSFLMCERLQLMVFDRLCPEFAKSITIYISMLLYKRFFYLEIFKIIISIFYNDKLVENRHSPNSYPIFISRITKFKNTQ